ncbi:MarR family winged helix-turn-helix transcriptional regulator [Aestuariivita sp.]|jgi:DNA-binding MarR family transcriptional regulator|uniref:MarR family winged helix-turn-helix transcriptional regulator n=1 Tax=Aestuariivita sp. TaxID=1872407 RepID=UPI00216F37C3|nr:MarR family winged helix-turn-helix transcriptional regulator [Aestuariivita sp.]MCE8008156.1 winged helix-turn-helix transcriptional regulator [Aestuariivita sp.]
MTQDQHPKIARTQAMVDRFGPLSLTMLNDTGLSPVWRLNFLANFFTATVYRELSERFDLSRPEFVILYCLRQQPGLLARDVAQVTGQPKNSISRAISDLVRKGVITRDTDPRDKRIKRLSLTDAGSDLLARALPILLDRQATMHAALSEAEQAEFLRLLDKMIHAMPNWVPTD